MFEEPIWTKDNLCLNFDGVVWTLGFVSGEIIYVFIHTSLLFQKIRNQLLLVTEERDNLTIQIQDLQTHSIEVELLKNNASEMVMTKLVCFLFLILLNQVFWIVNMLYWLF